jgi:hypothetical protein
LFLANSILSGEAQPYDDQTFDSDSSDSTSGEDADTTIEALQTFLDVQKIITYLYKYAAHLRSPAPRDRLLKLAKIDVSHFEEWDQLHLEEKFPLASPALRKRLGKANSIRRQMFKYHEKHHDKLARNLDFTDSIKSDLRADQDGINTGQLNSVTTPGLPKFTPSVKSAAPSTIVTTNTQTTIATYVETSKEILTDDNLSETSSAASEGPDEGSNLHLPHPPKGALEGNIFQCPYCYEMMKISGSLSWRYLDCHF